MSAVRLRERAGVGDVLVAGLGALVYFVVVLAKCAAWVALLLPAGYLAIAIGLALSGSGIALHGHDAPAPLPNGRIGELTVKEVVPTWRDAAVWFPRAAALSTGFAAAIAIARVKLSEYEPRPSSGRW